MFVGFGEVWNVRRLMVTEMGSREERRADDLGTLRMKMLVMAVLVERQGIVWGR